MVIFSLWSAIDSIIFFSVKFKIEIFFDSPMRFKVSLKKDGKEFEEVVIANSKKDAIKVALKNNPDAEALASDWTFKL